MTGILRSVHACKDRISQLDRSMGLNGKLSTKERRGTIEFPIGIIRGSHSISKIRREKIRGGGKQNQLHIAPANNSITTPTQLQAQLQTDFKPTNSDIVVKKLLNPSIVCLVSVLLVRLWH